MKKISTWAPIWTLLLLWGAVAAEAQGGGTGGGGGGGTGGGGGQTANELRELVDLVFAGVDERDEAKVDQATCLAEAVAARLQREEALGLIADAGDPDVAEERRLEALASVYAFVGRLSQQGRRLLALDASRVAVFDSESEAETLPGPQGEEQIITAAGTLGVRIEGMPHDADVEVYRLGERWCLDPLSMQ